MSSLLFIKVNSVLFLLFALVFAGLPLAFCQNIWKTGVEKGRRKEGNNHSLGLHLLSLEWARFSTELHLIQCPHCSEAELKFFLFLWWIAAATGRINFSILSKRAQTLVCFCALLWYKSSLVSLHSVLGAYAGRHNEITREKVQHTGRTSRVWSVCGYTEEQLEQQQQSSQSCLSLRDRDYAM